MTLQAGKRKREACSTAPPTGKPNLCRNDLIHTCMNALHTDAHHAATHPSAAASSVLHRPSGASMLAAVSIPMVLGSRVSRAAVITPLAALPPCSKRLVRAAADREDEQAVSMEIAGPVWQHTLACKIVRAACLWH